MVDLGSAVPGADTDENGPSDTVQMLERAKTGSAMGLGGIITKSSEIDQNASPQDILCFVPAARPFPSLQWPEDSATCFDQYVDRTTQRKWSSTEAFLNQRDDELVELLSKNAWISLCRTRWMHTSSSFSSSPPIL